MTGDDVVALQQALNGHLERHASLHDGADRLDEDGEYGPATRGAYRWVGWYVTGFMRRTVQAGATPAAQRLIRDPSRLDVAQLRRARDRQRDLVGDDDRPAKPGYLQVEQGRRLGLSGVANGVPHLHLGCEHGDPRTAL